LCFAHSWKSNLKKPEKWLQKQPEMSDNRKVKLNENIKKSRTFKFKTINLLSTADFKG